jgi:hypothetical protein
MIQINFAIMLIISKVETAIRVSIHCKNQTGTVSLCRGGLEPLSTEEGAGFTSSTLN